MQVLGAKVVTNARSPGAKCYGIVTMSSSTEVARCIAHLHRTELHGQQISVEKVGLIRCKLPRIDHLMQESVLTFLFLEKM